MIILKEDLLKHLNTAVKFIGNKNMSDQIQDIYLKINDNVLEFKATNLINFFKSSIYIEREKDDIDGSFLIDSKKIIEFLSLIENGIVNIKLTDSSLIIKQKKARGRFQIQIKNDSINFPKVPNEELIDISCSEIVNAISFVSFCTSTNTTRLIMSGIKCFSEDSGTTFVSSDGFRLSIYKTNKINNFPSMIVSGSFIEEVVKEMKNEKTAKCYFINDENIIFFKVGAFEYYSRSIDGSFPNYNRVIPQETKINISCNREEFIKNIKLTSVFLKEGLSTIVIEFTNKEMKIRTTKKDDEDNTMTQEIECENFESEEQCIAGFNYRYLLEFLNIIKGDTVKIDILRYNAPMIFSDKDNKDFIHIVMPIRVDK